MEPNEISKLLLQKFPQAEITVSDSTGSGDHFHISVVSEAFQDKSKVERHRMVYSALGNLVGGAIHAAALETKTPTEKKG